MKPAVVLATSFSNRLVERLCAQYEVIDLSRRGNRPIVLELQFRRARALVTRGSLKTDHALLDQLPNLGLIHCWGSDFSGVDQEVVKQRGILVGHGRAANASSVADMAMTLLLASSRGLIAADRFVRRGGWQDRLTKDLRVPPGLTGRNIGIYGLGAIGEKTAARAAVFEMQVGYHNRRRRPEVGYRYFASLAELAEWADCLVVSVRADKDNRHSVDREILKLLGPEGYLVNISRGTVISEEALIEALENRTIAGAGLDVFDNEPHVPERLKTLENVVLTPHIGATSLQAIEAMEALVLENLRAFFAGQPIPTPAAGASSA